MIQRQDGEGLSPADHIDPNFGTVLRQVVQQGVVPLAYRAIVSPAGATAVESVEVLL